MSDVAGAVAVRQAESRFGVAYLQARLSSEFPLVRHIGVVVEHADGDGIVLSAPLPPNANDKGTAFGGSLFSVAVLTGWAWLARYLDEAQLDADAVIQESAIRYWSPVRGTLRATLRTPPAARIEKFSKMLRRSGRGRIHLEVDVHEGLTLATEFKGDFAATIRARET